MADQKPHEPGTMDITEQEKTFDGFMRFTKNAVIAIIVILVLLAIFRT
ncbi:aa3-type cytochrome c oxidase subunit IV [Jannaschia sp. Os4]|nr:aa3-type cytochrome c oxidase subunit IV [Jannaschia sp. Os4]MBM2574995.1 aa3-type cytochrome c oxidase subunit IV [Jannaschia sp. Os4]